MTWYSTGTIALITNSKTVTGTGVDFTGVIRYGDILLVDDKLYEIEEAINQVQFTLTKPFPGATVMGRPYAIIRNMSNASNYDLMTRIDEFLQDRTTQLNEFTTWANGTVNGGPNADGKYPLTDRNGVITLVYCPAKMAQMSGASPADAITALQTAMTNLQTMLSDYSVIKQKVEDFTGVTLETLGGQPLNSKLTTISNLDMALNTILVANGSGGFSAYPVSDRGLVLLQQDTQAKMRTVIGVGSGGGGGGGGSALGRRVAIIGTSLCQLCSYGTATELSHTNRSWINWALMLSGGRGVMPIWHDMNLYPGWEAGDNVGKPRGFRGLNAGVSSDHIDNIQARAGYLVNNVECDIVIIDGGINDLGNNSLSADDIAQMREETVDFLLNNGKTVILLAMPLVGANYAPIGSPNRRKAHYINARNRQFILRKANAYLFDWYSYMMDNTLEGGVPKDGFTVDGGHFAPKGAHAVGKALAKVIENLLPPAERRVWSPEDIYDATLAPYGNFFQNSFLFGTSGTLDAGGSGQIANFFRGGLNSGAGSCVFSKVIGDDGGQAQRMTITPDATTDGQFVFRVTDITHGLAEGTWVQASIEVKVEAGFAGFQGINLQMRDLATGGLTSHGFKIYAGFNLTDEAWSGTIMTPAIQVKAGGQIRWRFEVNVQAGSAGQAVVTVQRPELRPVTDPKLIVNGKAGE